MANSVDLKEFVAGFLLEADEHLHSVNRNLVATAEALKQKLPEPRAVRELFRSLHTIKGLASMVGAEPIVDLSHEMESILRTADRAGGRLSEPELDLMLQGTRAIEERIHAIAQHGINGASAAPAPLLEALALAQNPQKEIDAPIGLTLNLPPEIERGLSPSDREQVIQAGRAGHRVVLVEFQPSPEKASQGFNITSVREKLGKLGDLVKVVPHSAPQSATGIAFFLLMVTDAENSALAEATGDSETPVQNVTATPEASTASSSSLPLATLAAEDPPEWAPTDHSSIRVDVRRLDEALERLSELVVTRSKMARVAADLTSRGMDTRELSTVIAELTRQLKRLRTAITQARMVPLAELLQRLPLVVRGLTKDSGKSVNVTIQASSAEVDKAVADKLFPAVVHLVRNAVDHALESPDERKARGKAETGTLSIVCDDSSGTNLVMTVSDDGRGINREIVARKAGRPVARTDEELLQQIAMPGLSTRDDVTHTSGRGMGMDIVKRTVEMLGGMLSLRTTPDQGTTFTVRVPVSVTIIDVFSFISEGQTFVAPVAMIEEIIEINPANLIKSPVPSGSGLEPRLIQRRGETIPFFTLDAILKRRPEGAIPSRALIVQQLGGTVALGIDRMLGQQEVVVRPLDDQMFRSPGMTGATDLGDGRPTLVLDLATLGAVVMHNAGMSP